MNEIKLESRLRLRHNIPDHLTYIIASDAQCPICKDKDIFYYITPFIEADVPVEHIIELCLLKFGLKVSKDMINSHKSHYSVTFNRSSELKDRQNLEHMFLESSSPHSVDVDSVITDNISSLYARLLELRASGDLTGKDYIETSKTLMNWVALKKKLDGELSDFSGVDLSDVIKIRGEKNGTIAIGKRVIKTETRTGAIIKRDGSERRSEISRVDIPCKKQ